MPKDEFVVYLANPADVNLDDPYYDPDDSRSMPEKIPVEFVYGSNRAKRVVDMLRRHHGGAMFQVKAMPTEHYAPEISVLKNRARSAADGGYGWGVQRVARQAIECAGLVGKSAADLAPLEDGNEEQSLDDRTEFAGTTFDVAADLEGAETDPPKRSELPIAVARQDDIVAIVPGLPADPAGDSDWIIAADLAKKLSFTGSTSLRNARRNPRSIRADDQSHGVDPVGRKWRKETEQRVWYYIPSLSEEEARKALN